MEAESQVLTQELCDLDGTRWIFDLVRSNASESSDESSDASSDSCSNVASNDYSGSQRVPSDCSSDEGPTIADMYLAASSAGDASAATNETPSAGTRIVGRAKKRVHKVVNVVVAPNILSTQVLRDECARRLERKVAEQKAAADGIIVSLNKSISRLRAQIARDKHVTQAGWKLAESRALLLRQWKSKYRQQQQLASHLVSALRLCIRDLQRNTRPEVEHGECTCPSRVGRHRSDCPSRTSKRPRYSPGHLTPEAISALQQADVALRTIRDERPRDHIPKVPSAEVTPAVAKFAVASAGSVSSAARNLGVHERTVRRRLEMRDEVTPRPIDEKRQLVLSIVRTIPLSGSTKTLEELHQWVREQLPSSLQEVSRNLVYDVLRQQLQSRRARVRPILSLEAQAERLHFATVWLEKSKTEAFIQSILFSDEKIFYVRSGKLRLWVPRLSADGDHNCTAIVDVRGKHPAQEMFFCAIGIRQTTSLISIKGNITGEVYAEVLKVVNEEIDAKNSIWQQDNAPVHTTPENEKIIDEMFGGRLVAEPPQVPARGPRMRWPPNSPDLSPIEHYWSWLAHKYRKDRVSTLEQQRTSLTVLHESAEAKSVREKLIRSFPRRLEACIAAGGNHTKY
jgi:hypothetical protein